MRRWLVVTTWSERQLRSGVADRTAASGSNVTRILARKHLSGANKSFIFTLQGRKRMPRCHLFMCGGPDECYLDGDDRSLVHLGPTCHRPRTVVAFRLPHFHSLPIKYQIFKMKKWKVFFFKKNLKIRKRFDDDSKSRSSFNFKIFFQLVFMVC